MDDPARLPRFDGLRPLKRWRYVGVYGPDMMLCAGVVHLAGIPMGFYAVWDRAREDLRQGTLLRPGGRITVPDGRVHVRDRGVEVDLRLELDTDGWDCTSPHGGGWIWTCKSGARAVGVVRVDGVPHPLDARALIDDSAGYHARETVWDWSAGVGEADDGRAVMWNLVTGLHDAPERSERAVWVDGTAAHVGPVTFSDGLDAVAFSDAGAQLAFTAEAERARHDKAPLFESEYRQPFGTFTGTLPGGVRLARAYGVMERHRARW